MTCGVLKSTESGIADAPAISHSSVPGNEVAENRLTASSSRLVAKSDVADRPWHGAAEHNADLWVDGLDHRRKADCGRIVGGDRRQADDIGGLVGDGSGDLTPGVVAGVRAGIRQQEAHVVLISDGGADIAEAERLDLAGVPLSAREQPRRLGEQGPQSGDPITIDPVPPQCVVALPLWAAGRPSISTDSSPLTIV